MECPLSQWSISSPLCWLFISCLQKKSEPLSNKIEMLFTLTFNCRFGQLHVDARTVMRRVQEADRIVIVYTTLMVAASTGLQFRQNGCLILSELSAKAGSILPPSASSLMQTYYRIHAETTACDENGDPPHVREHIAYFRDFVLSAQSESMRAYQLEIQSAMLREFLLSDAPLQLGASGVVGCIPA